MLTKGITSIRASLSYLILIPIICCMLFSFSKRQSNQHLGSSESDSTVQDDLQFITPIETKKFIVSSAFGERIHPMTGVLQFHTGIDLVSNEGVPVVSPESGTVLDSHYDSARGNFIVIQHNNQYTTSYSHLRDRSVKPGEKVNKGQTIGSVGNTGLSVNSHLHYEVLKDGKAVNPGIYLSNKK